MKWDIFGKKKLLREINRYEKAILEISGDVKTLSKKFGLLIEELKKIQEISAIPEVKPFIRDPEKIYNEEKKEGEAYNLWKN